MALVHCEEERERDEMRKRLEKGINKKKRRIGRRSGRPGLVDARRRRELRWCCGLPRVKDGRGRRGTRQELELLADEGSEEVAHEVRLQAVLGRRGRREREWSDGFLKLLMRLGAVVDRAGVPIEEGGWRRWVGSGRNEGIPRQGRRQRDRTNGTSLLKIRVGLVYI